MPFGLKGFSHLVSTGCTSSTDAIAYAAQHITLGRINTVLTGGVDAPLAHSIMLGFCVMKVMTPSWNHDPQRASRPFSRDRDVFVLGEGAYFFVLEEMDHALERGARIYAEVTGYGSTCDAHHRVRLDETGVEPARAMTLAIKDAGLQPEEINYINLHGTATEHNDAMESRAIANVSAPLPPAGFASNTCQASFHHSQRLFELSDPSRPLFATSPPPRNSRSHAPGPPLAADAARASLPTRPAALR